MTVINLLIVILSFLSLANCYHNPHFIGNRTSIVHLFEWKWNDIANECEQFLGRKGYGGVQISPVTENVIIAKRPWWERYQPISYKLRTRSGNENELRAMIEKCNAMNVRIYADIILNHMSAAHVNGAVGIDGSVANFPAKSFPQIPYSSDDFHPSCSIRNYNNATEVRVCELQGLLDLNHTKPNVQRRQIDLMNSLIDLGIAGFRIDAAKHMWPTDLQMIYSQLKNLNTKAGFPQNSRPFIYQEVIDLGEEAVKKTEYSSLGVVTEFRVSNELGKMFNGHNKLTFLKNWGPEWSFLTSKDALVFVDNHDNQRGHGPGSGNILTHKQSEGYKLATIFTLSHPYGLPRIMSSYGFTDPDQGPPSDANAKILPPLASKGNNSSCSNGWICEHRWSEISNMIVFRNLVQGTEILNWWDNGNNQIAFSRGNKGYVIISNEDTEISVNLQTSLPSGIYCDIISGNLQENKKCSGRSLTVDQNGQINIHIPRQKIAIVVHILAKAQ